MEILVMLYTFQWFITPVINPYFVYIPQYRALRSRIMSSSDAGTSATSSQGTMTAMEGNHVQGDGSGEDNSCSSEDLEEFRRQCLDFSLRRITRNVLGKTRQFCAPTHCGGSIDTCQWLDQTFDDNELNSRVKPVMPKYLCRELLVWFD